MAGAHVARGLLVSALVLVTLCAASEPAAAAAKAESCDSETGTGVKEPLSAWVVCQWTVVMALARCAALRRGSLCKSQNLSPVQCAPLRSRV
jgi:hypothetical protein